MNKLTGPGMLVSFQIDLISMYVFLMSMTILQVLAPSLEQQKPSAVLNRTRKVGSTNG